jgi:hypothetical protein
MSYSARPPEERTPRERTVEILQIFWEILELRTINQVDNQAKRDSLLREAGFLRQQWGVDRWQDAELEADWPLR